MRKFEFRNFTGFTKEIRSCGPSIIPLYMKRDILRLLQKGKFLTYLTRNPQHIRSETQDDVESNR